MADELKLNNCPFCGGEAELQIEKLGPLLASQMISVSCKECHATSCASMAPYGKVSDDAGCIKAWNKRVNDG